MATIKCPACGGTTEIDDNRSSCFCSYCGAKVYVDDNTHRVETTKNININKNINYHKTYTDEAKIRKIESDERMQEWRLAAEHDKQKREKRSSLGSNLFVLVFVLGIFILVGCYFGSLKEASDRQEQELQELVDEVMQDIENGNFSEAYIKAEKIRYTEGWSSEIEDKWDSTRKSVIDQIKKAEKDANKNNSDDKWWNPFD